MANPISSNIKTGTIGELLVQLRLLQYGVQAAPPLKDSGNDLIALKGYEVRTIQVKTSVNGVPYTKNLPEHYHLLALVMLKNLDDNLLLDETKIYIVPKLDVLNLRRYPRHLEHYLLTAQHVDRLFNNE